MDGTDNYRARRAQETDSILNLGDYYREKVSLLRRLSQHINYQLSKITDTEMPSSPHSQLVNSLQFRTKKINALFFKNRLNSISQTDLNQFIKEKKQLIKTIDSIQEQKQKLESLKERVRLELDKEAPHLQKIEQKYRDSRLGETTRESRILAPFNALIRKIIFLKDCWNYYQHSVKVINKFNQLKAEVTEIESVIANQNAKVAKAFENIEKIEQLADQIIEKTKIQMAAHRTPKKVPSRRLNMSAKRSL